jgi:hypothetical protein
MRDLSPADRENVIKNVLVNNNIKLPNGQDAPELPADFFSKNNYTYTYDTYDDDGTKHTHHLQLDALSAAVVVARLEEQFADMKVDIAALYSTATKLRMKAIDLQTPAAALSAAFSNVDSTWGPVIADAGDIGGTSVVNLRNNVNKIREMLLGGTMQTPSGLINDVANAVQKQADTLETSAQDYLTTEENALWQFGVHSGDYLEIADKANSKAPSDPYYPTQK